MNKKLIVAGTLAIAALIAGVLFFTRDRAPAEPKIPTLGLLLPIEFPGIFLKNQLAQLGYVEGETINYQIVVSSNPEEYEAAIQSLIDSDVDIIAGTGAPVAITASRLTTSIPIVFTSNQDQFAREIEPIIKKQGRETNLTGIIASNPAEKRFEFMMEIDPTIKVVFVPYNPDNQPSVDTLALIEGMAATYGVRVQKYEFRDDTEADQALSEVPQGIDAILLGDEVPSLVRIPQWADLSIERRVPLIVPLGQFSEGLITPKVLMGYGGGIQELYRQSADLIDQILKGTAPADLPVRPSDVYLTVSMGAADALGIDIPDEILSQASQILRDEVSVPTVAQTTPAVAEDGTACNAIIKTPVGELSICATSRCELLEDSGFATITDKVAVASCSTEAVLGVCSTASSDTYFYTGDISVIETGCTSNGGEWKSSAE